jgi:hypothetical protein
MRDQTFKIMTGNCLIKELVSTRIRGKPPKSQKGNTMNKRTRISVLASSGLLIFVLSLPWTKSAEGNTDPRPTISDVCGFPSPSLRNNLNLFDNLFEQKDYVSAEGLARSRSKVAGLYFGAGLGYASLNSSDLKMLNQAGLGRIGQGSFGGHGDIGMVLDLRYIMITGMLSWYFSAHTWENCFGSGLDVRLYGRMRDFELKIGPCIQYLCGKRIENLQPDKWYPEIVPFFLVGKTQKMWLRDDNKDGFTKGEGPLFFGGGIDLVGFLGEVGAITIGLKLVYRGEHSYQAFKIGEEVPLETKASPYSVTATMGFMILPF